MVMHAAMRENLRLFEAMRFSFPIEADAVYERIDALNVALVRFRLETDEVHSAADTDEQAVPEHMASPTLPLSSAEASPRNADEIVWNV